MSSRDGIADEVQSIVADQARYDTTSISPYSTVRSQIYSAAYVRTHVRLPFVLRVCAGPNPCRFSYDLLLAAYYRAHLCSRSPTCVQIIGGTGVVPNSNRALPNRIRYTISSPGFAINSKCRLLVHRVVAVSGLDIGCRARTQFCFSAKKTHPTSKEQHFEIYSEPGRRLESTVSKFQDSQHRTMTFNFRPFSDSLQEVLYSNFSIAGLRCQSSEFISDS